MLNLLSLEKPRGNTKLATKPPTLLLASLAKSIMWIITRFTPKPLTQTPLNTHGIFKEIDGAACWQPRRFEAEGGAP